MKILRAIRELSSPVSPPPLPEPVPHEAAERRQVTVMFSDLVGSTALSARMDPEDLRDLIGAYHNCVAETVGRFEGFVAKYMGDGVLSYFGYPQAHEDDPERAARAGLALVDAMGRLSASEPLQVRIGIGTGLVVVGDLIGSGDSQERGVVGETPNLAARLQAVAAPNAIVVGPRTRRLLADLFEYQDLGQIDVKGFAEPVHAYAEPLIAIAAEHGFPQWLAFGRVLDTWLQAELGGEATVAQLRCAIDNRDHNPTYVPYFLGLLAAMQLKYGETAEGLATIASALELTGGTGARLWDPELLRLKGELLLASDPRTATEAHVAFSQAIDIARRHSSKSLELRVATSFAGLLYRQRKRAEARDLLAPVYGWFREGFDTRDLKGAKALLDELAS